MLGLNAAHSIYACLWCDVPKDGRYKITATAIGMHTCTLNIHLMQVGYEQAS